MTVNNQIADKTIKVTDELRRVVRVESVKRDMSCGAFVAEMYRVWKDNYTYEEQKD